MIDAEIGVAVRGVDAPLACRCLRQLSRPPGARSARNDVDARAGDQGNSAARRRGAAIRTGPGIGRSGLRACRATARRRHRAAAEIPPTAPADRQRLHDGPQAAQRGHRAQESRGARPARQSRAVAAGAGLYRDETRRLGAARAGAPGPGRARQRDLLVLAGSVGLRCQPIRRRRFAGCRM